MPENENKEIGTGTDLSGMFKGVNTNPTQKFYVEQQSSYTGTPKIFEWTMKISHGLIKNEKQAQYTLLGFALITIIVSLFLFFGAIYSPSPPPADQIINVAGPEGKR